jgi:IS4 transposase
VWLYAVWGLPGRPAAVRELYRRRFGIESSYRQVHVARVRTSSRSPLLRLLFVGLALIPRDVWVWLHWEVLAKKRAAGGPGSIAVAGSAALVARGRRGDLRSQRVGALPTPVAAIT